MIMKLELSAEVQASLAVQAQANGLSLEAYAEKLLSERAASAAKPRARGRKSLARLFAESPLKGLDLRFERDPDMGRPVKL
jgi:hypothetical protein